MSFFSNIFNTFTNLFKSKDLEGNITNFQTKIDSIVNDLLLPYTQPEKGKDNMQFRDIINLLDPKKCNKIAITLSSNLDKNYTKLQLEQFSSSILLGKESPDCKDESCSDNAEKTIDNKNSKVSKKEICNAIAVHYVKILNVIAAILTAVNPSDNICLNRLRNLLTIINEDEQQGVSSICDIRNTIVKDSIMNEPGMKELLMLYYYHLQQDSETESEKLNVKNQYENLVTTFTNVVMIVNPNLKKYKEPTNSMKSIEEEELEELEAEEDQEELESGIGNEGEPIEEIANELNENNTNTSRATSQNISKLTDNINKFKTEENEKLQQIAINIEKLTKFIEILQRKNSNNTVTSKQNGQSNIQPNTTTITAPEQANITTTTTPAPELANTTTTTTPVPAQAPEQANTNLDQPNTNLDQPNTTTAPEQPNTNLDQPNTTTSPALEQANTNLDQPNTTTAPAPEQPNTNLDQPNTTTSPAPEQPNTNLDKANTNLDQPNTTLGQPITTSNQSNSNIITSNATPSTTYSPAQISLLKSSNTGEITNVIQKINTSLNKSKPVKNTLSGGSKNTKKNGNTNNRSRTKKNVNNNNVNTNNVNNNNVNNNENKNENENETETENGNETENENENENENETQTTTEPETQTTTEPETQTTTEPETQTTTEPKNENENENENGNDNDNVNLKINESENVTENGNTTNNSISNPMIKKFVDFVNIYSKIDNIDEKILQIVNTAFKSYHNYEPNSSESSDSSDDSMYISEDAMEEMCVKNINDKSMIPISLNDSNPNMITYIKIYKDMKDNYITNCNNLFSILEDRILEKSKNNEKDEVEHFKIKTIGYDDLVTIEKDVRDKLSNMYALCHKQYQQGIVALFKALKDKNV
uniref:Uncharacterized protein n=1 Tax=viral metagenome TaxID=1070528 RepID=A0A6C0F107_9ZZZZ